MDHEVDHMVFLCDSQQGTQITSSLLVTDESIPVEVQAIVDEFAVLFATPNELPPRCVCDHSIPVIPGAQPVNIRPYRHSPNTKDEIVKQIAELLSSGVIQRSSSSFSFPVILVRKKGGEWRMCIDYRRLNALTSPTTFPIPVIEELLDELSGASWFSKLDLRAGYHQIRLAQGEEYKTAFQTHSGHYEYKVMSFGLAGAPATFQGAMNTTLQPVLRRCALVFFDDILIYSRTLEDHIQHLHEVLSLLRRDKWFIKQSKCSFAQRSLSYLGFVISGEGVATEPEKNSEGSVLASAAKCNGT